jgi:hypothetical protein
MESWWRHARRDMQFQLGPEGMKSDADCPFIDAAFAAFAALSAGK